MSFRYIPILVLLGLPSATVGQQQHGGVRDAREATPLRKLIDESIEWYQIRRNPESETAMKPVVVMRWPNNPRASADGATVIWISEGRPEAIASIYPWEGKLFCHEFDSLSRTTVVATYEGNVAWSPAKPGIEFRTVSDWPAPARSRVGRLRQMKTLVTQFSGRLLGWTLDDSQREELRLLPRPLYRYEIDPPSEILDGGLFALATGTDPEILLVLEATMIAGEPQWQYGFVRQSSGKLEGRFRGELVWSANRHPPQKDPTSTHIEFSRPLDEVLPSGN